jgi:low temperature requirement protein LtrA
MPSAPLVRRMSPRDPYEAHRASTPLELFFDLTFVVAVAQASSTLHHELVAGHARDALAAYPIVFFAVWWAWMNFTWFASAYDCDDAPYRIAVFVQMAGVLVFAAGVPRFLEDLDPSIAVVGYVIMRIGLIAQWLRAAASHPEGRQAGRRYAVGVFACQVAWIGLSMATDGWTWIVLAAPIAVAELAVPMWAERAQRTPWHPGHIGERYGLFTIIVLGESVLSATVAIQVAIDEGEGYGDFVTIAVGGLLIVASLWWLYFDQPVDHILHRAREGFDNHEGWLSFIWGYGHYVVFASAAAVGVGLAVAVDHQTHHSELTDLQAGFALTVPVTVFIATVWALHFTSKTPGRLRTYGVPVTAVLVLASSWTDEPALVTGLVLAALLAIAVVLHAREPDAAGVAEVPADEPVG